MQSPCVRMLFPESIENSLARSLKKSAPTVIAQCIHVCLALRTVLNQA